MNLYERREWPLFPMWGIAAGFVGLFAAVGAVSLQEGNAFFFIRSVVPALILVALLSMLAGGSVYVAVSPFELKVRVGYTPFHARALSLEKILRVERSRVAWYQAKSRKGWGIRVERYAVAPGPALLIIPVEGKPFLIQSRHAEEILTVLKRTRPEIEIV